MDPVEKPRRPRGDRISAGAIAARVEEILPLVIDGAPFRDIKRHVCEQTDWGSGISQPTLKRYISRAVKLIAKGSEESAKSHTDRAIARYERLFWRASKRGDLNTARQIEDSLVKLLGLAAPERHRITVEDVEAEIRRMEAEIAAAETEQQKD